MSSGSGNSQAATRLAGAPLPSPSPPSSAGAASSAARGGGGGGGSSSNSGPANYRKVDRLGKGSFATVRLSQGKSAKEEGLTSVANAPSPPTQALTRWLLCTNHSP